MASWRITAKTAESQRKKARIDRKDDDFFDGDEQESDVSEMIKNL